jgi:hypothetical protein
MNTITSKLEYYIEHNDSRNVWELVLFEPDTNHFETLISMHDDIVSDSLVVLKRQLVGYANTCYNFGIKLNQVEFLLT